MRTVTLNRPTLASMAASVVLLTAPSISRPDERCQITAPRVEDFALTGDGSAAAWKATDWFTLKPIEPSPTAYPTRGKLLWSDRGLYLRAECQDQKLTCTARSDNDDLYLEDVVEAFFWPEESQRLYFEYEVSPLGAELPLMVANDGQRFFGWLPWHYHDERKVRRAVVVHGGDQKAGATVSGWSAEVFVPFALLSGMGNCPPQTGSRWRMNAYRIDYDAGRPAHYAWCSRTGPRFHTFRQFGTIVFVASGGK